MSLKLQCVKTIMSVYLHRKCSYEVQCEIQNGDINISLIEDVLFLSLA